MKKLHYLLLVILSAPALADPSMTQQYETLRQGYYQFDPHAYKSFTCHVSASTVNASVAYVKQILLGHEGSLQLKEDVDSYSLTVDPDKGLSIHNPIMDITMLSEEGLADPAQVKQGIAEMKAGFDKQVQGVDQMISGLFNEYMDTTPELTSVTHDGKKWIVRYRLGGVDTTDTIDGRRTHQEANINGTSIVSDADYAPLPGGKLTVQGSKTRMTQGPQHFDSSMSVTYQKLGSLQVPATMVNKITLNMPGVAQSTASTTIAFQNCKIVN
ncbi:MAG TPA: hypothetical protein VF651_01160 [Gammaproteobacteria bacterium]